MPQIKQSPQRSAIQRRPQYRRGPDLGVCLTEEGIGEFLDACREKGLTEGTVEWYRRGLKRLYEELPEDKTIRHGTLGYWRERLIQQGYAPGTINSFLSSCNSFVEYAGHREYQLIGQLELEISPQPELTRAEYLRLLQTARALEKEKIYLLIKLFGSTSLTVQELPKVTVEAVETGQVSITFSRVKSVVHLPAHLQKELLGYAKRNGYLSGAIFRTRNGTPVNRAYVSTAIRRLCAEARVPEEKGNPQCLKRLYQATRSVIENNVALLVEQAMDRLLEQEQLNVGWEEC